MSENINGGQNLWEIEIISEYQNLCLNNNSWQLKKNIKSSTTLNDKSIWEMTLSLKKVKLKMVMKTFS